LQQLSPLKFENYANTLLPMFKKKYWPIISTVLREISFELAGAATFQVLVNTLI
jgi:hypothetical protein